MLSLFNDVSSSIEKQRMLKLIYFMDEGTANQLANEILSGYIEKNIVNDELLVLANKTLVRTKTENDTNKILNYNKIFLESENEKLISGALFALAEMDSTEAVELVLNDFENYERSSLSYFLTRNIEKVIEYCDVISAEKFRKLVLTVPLEEFREILQVKQLQRSVELDYDELYAAIDEYNAIEKNERAVGYQGYAVYRDGVLGNYQWHAGIMVESSTSASKPIVHHPGLGEEVAYGTYADFLDGNNFKGFKCYIGMSSNEKDKVVSIAKTLTTEGITYTASTLLVSSETITKIQPADIDALRCDGVVEYCYEYNGMRVQGTDSNWNISLPGNAHNGAVYTPVTQAAALTGN